MLPLPHSLIMQLRIHWQAVLLLMAGMSFVPNTTLARGHTEPAFLQYAMAFGAAGMAAAAFYSGWTGVVGLAAAMAGVTASIVVPLK